MPGARQRRAAFLDSLSDKRHPKVGKHIAMSCATEAVRVSLPSKSGATDGVGIVNTKDERAELVPRSEILLRERGSENGESSSATCMPKKLTSLTSANLRPKRNYDRVVERERRDDDLKKMKSQKRRDGGE